MTQDYKIPSGREPEFMGQKNPDKFYLPTSLGEDMLEEPYLPREVKKSYHTLIASVLAASVATMSTYIVLMPKPTVMRPARAGAPQVLPSIPPTFAELGTQLNAQGYKVRLAKEFLEQVRVEKTDKGFLLTPLHPKNAEGRRMILKFSKTGSVPPNTNWEKHTELLLPKNLEGNVYDVVLEPEDAKLWESTSNAMEISRAL